MMKKMSLHTKNSRRMIVTAICVATLGAQLAPVMNVQAATDSGNSASSTTTGSTSSAPVASTPSVQSNGTSSGSDGSTGSEANSNGTDTSASGSTSNDVNGSGTTDSQKDSETTPEVKGTTDDTVTDGTTDKTSDKEVAAPVVVNNPEATKTNQEAGFAADKHGVQANAHIEVSNESGTSDAKGTDTFNSSAIVESNDANKISAVMVITDDVPAGKGNAQTFAYPTLYLPSYFANSNTAADIVVDKGTAKDAADWQTTLLKNAGLPESTNIKYTQGTTEDWQTFQSLSGLGADFDVSKITGIQIAYEYNNGNYDWMPANTTYKVTVPLKVVSNDPKNANVSKVGVSDMGNNLNDWTILNTDNLYNNNGNRTTSFRIADKLAGVKGQLGAVTEQQSNVLYTGVNSDIQDLMPDIEKGDVSYENFAGVKTDSTESDLYSGSNIIVNDKALQKVAAAVNDKGYSLLLDSNGNIGDQNYIYTVGNHQVTITPNTTGSTSTTDLAPYVYITLRKLLDTKDSSMTVGDSWNSANSLADVTTSQDKATPATTADLATDSTAANHVTTTISDPNGILDKNGKAIKDGTFTVTYSMKDGNYTVSKTATVTVKAAAPSHNSGSTGNNNSGTTTGNNGGSTTTTDNGNDGSNTSTGTDTDTNTTDPDTPVVSPSDPNDVDIPVVSPNEIPDASELTGNTTNNNNATNENNNGGSTATSNNTVATTTANTSNGQTAPVYTVGNNASGVLTGYTPTSSTQVAQAATTATFPQTGNANDSKLQVIGALIVSMMATVAGFAFGKKRHAEKA